MNKLVFILIGYLVPLCSAAQVWPTAQGSPKILSSALNTQLRSLPNSKLHSQLFRKLGASPSQKPKLFDISLEIGDDLNFSNSIFLDKIILEHTAFRNKANFERTRFFDTTSFGNCQFQSDAEFQFSRFYKAVDFSWTRFYKEATFSSDTFQGRALFFAPHDVSGSNKGHFLNFSKGCSFESSLFQEEANFRYDGFAGGAYFPNATFLRQAIFHDAHFFGLAMFSSCKFQSSALFKGTEFDEKTIWKGAAFHGVADFSYANFHRPVDLTCDTFAQSVIFDEASFNGYTILSDLVLGPDAVFSFRDARMPDLLDISLNGKLNNVWDFTSCDFNFSTSYYYDDPVRRWHFINVYKSDIPKIKFDYQHYKLCFFDPSRHDTLLGKWWWGDNLLYLHKKYSRYDPDLFLVLSRVPAINAYLKNIFPSATISDSAVARYLQKCIDEAHFPARLNRDEIIATYEKVLKSFENEGQLLSREALDIEYRDYKNGWFILPHIWNVYGYHKERIFIWTLCFLLGFCIITYFIFDKLNKEVSQGGVYYIANIPAGAGTNHPGYWYKRAWNVLMYTSTIFFLFGLKLDNLNFKKAAVLYVILIYSTGVLCLAYIAAFVLQK